MYVERRQVAAKLLLLANFLSFFYKDTTTNICIYIYKCHDDVNQENVFGTASDCKEEVRAIGKSYETVVLSDCVHFHEHVFTTLVDMEL